MRFCFVILALLAILPTSFAPIGSNVASSIATGVAGGVASGAAGGTDVELRLQLQTNGGTLLTR